MQFNFKTNLFSSCFCSGVCHCCEAAWCSRCMVARQYNFIHNHNTTSKMDWSYFCSSCLVDSCCCYAIPVALTYQTLDVRRMIRERYHVVKKKFRATEDEKNNNGIPGMYSVLDLLAVSFLQSCVAAQQELELASRSYHYRKKVDPKNVRGNSIERME